VRARATEVAVEAERAAGAVVRSSRARPLKLALGALADNTDIAMDINEEVRNASLVEVRDGESPLIGEVFEHNSIGHPFSRGPDLLWR